MGQPSETNILVVSPSESVSADLKRILSTAGYKCHFLPTIRQAATYVEKNATIDIVIIPLGDKEQADFELLKQIRRSPRLHYLPVIMLCSLCNQDIVCEAKLLGASSIVTLPILEEVLLARVESGLHDGRRVVLVVDDEPTILDVLKLSLELERFKVVTALSAEIGLEILKAQTVHAVVSDIMLPGMNGMDLLVTVKEKWPGLPVILMTGYSGKFTPEDAISAGADGYFTKPFKNVQMVRTLRDVIYRSEHARAGITGKMEVKEVGRL